MLRLNNPWCFMLWYAVAVAVAGGFAVLLALASSVVFAPATPATPQALPAVVPSLGQHIEVREVDGCHVYIVGEMALIDCGEKKSM